MFHFREKVCLIQIASQRHLFIVDPIGVKDLSALKPLFANRRIKKVFHGSDYDVRSLFRDFDIVVHNLFDTELASRFLGFQQSGLDAMLQTFFNVKLEKKYQKKDWSMRPLPEAMITYAAKDVHHLLPLAKRLKKDLSKKNRLTWVEEECDLLSKVRPNATHTGPLFLSFKGAGRLPPEDLAVLEALLAFDPPRHVRSMTRCANGWKGSAGRLVDHHRHAPPRAHQLGAGCARRRARACDGHLR